MIVASSYTATSSGWGVWFVAAVTLIAAGAWVTYRMVLLAVAEWRRRHRAPHPLAPPRPLPTYPRPFDRRRP